MDVEIELANFQVAPFTDLQVDDVSWGIILGEVVTMVGRSGLMALNVD
jgi:ABC-type bacteriocin/lantibiotic exporter with double-glycine peptidase domain